MTAKLTVIYSSFQQNQVCWQKEKLLLGIQQEKPGYWRCLSLDGDANVLRAGCANTWLELPTL